MTMFSHPQAEIPRVIEPRTSVLAILGLVLSFICFIPGLSIIGLIFSIAALIFITTSNGRLRGRGLAITGVVLGLVFSVFWVAVFAGSAAFWNAYKNHLVQVDGLMTAIESGDEAAVKQYLAPETAAKVSAADIAAFRAEYQAELGPYKSMPTGFMEVFQGLNVASPLLSQFQARTDLTAPAVAAFNKGTGLVLAQARISRGPEPVIRSPGSPPIDNVMVVGPSDSKWTLFDPNRAPVIAPSTQPQPQPQPTTP